jgi:AcrR family transcriptional regulator
MPSKGERNRQRIVEAANLLFYQRGYNQTSFSDIAAAAEVPRGNFYYYFKTKDDILEAVIEDRMELLRGLLPRWEAEYPDPKGRLKRFVEILLNEEHNILRYGCPMGTLNGELAKGQPELQAKVGAMFEFFRAWLEREFKALGFGDQSRDLALQILAANQGVTVVSNVYRDRRFLQREVERLKAWVDAL